MEFSTCSIATFKKEIDTTRKITKKTKPYRSVVGKVIRGYDAGKRVEVSLTLVSISVRRGVPKSSRYKLAHDWSSASNSTPLKSHLNLFSHTHLSISSTSSLHHTHLLALFIPLIFSLDSFRFFSPGCFLDSTSFSTVVAWSHYLLQEKSLEIKDDWLTLQRDYFRIPKFYTSCNLRIIVLLLPDQTVEQ